MQTKGTRGYSNLRGVDKLSGASPQSILNIRDKRAVRHQDSGEKQPNSARLNNN